MAEGIRVWRYRKNKWLYRNQAGQEYWIEPQRVDTKGVRLVEGDFLVEEMARSTKGDALPDVIRWDAIISVFPDHYVPLNGGLWCKTDDDRYQASHGLRRIYHRSMAKRGKTEEVLPPYIAICGDDMAYGDIAVDRGLESVEPVLLFRRGGARDSIQIEAFEGIIQLQAVADVYAEAADADFKAFAAGCNWIAKHKVVLEKAFSEAHQAIEQNSPQRLLGAVDSLKGLLEGVTGAKPGPTQGHNVPLQLVSAVNDAANTVDAFRRDGWGAFQTTSDNSPHTSALGDVTKGVSTVDNCWQAIGTVADTIFGLINLGALIAQQHGASQVAPPTLTGAPGQGISGPTRMPVSRSLQQKNLTINLKVQVMNLGVDALKSLSTVSGAVKSVADVAAGNASILGPFGSVGLPFIGAGTSFISMVRLAHQAHRAQKRLAKLKRIKQLVDANKGKKGIMNPTTEALLSFAVEKLDRKHSYKAAEATVAGLSTGVGIGLGIVALVVAANAWNPVGWGLGAVVTVAGAGLLSYKIYRKYQSQRTEKKRGWSGKDFPQKLMEAYKKEASLISNVMKSASATVSSLDFAILDGLLAGFGIDGWRIGLPGEERVAMNMITRRLAY